MKKLLWAAVIVFALDAAIFRSGWYSHFLSTKSVQGRSQHVVEELEEMAPTPSANILLLGDARLAEGFNAGVASARVVEHGLRFLPGGSPGTNIRDWCYFLEEIDPNADRYRAVVLAFPSFRDRAPLDRNFDDLGRDADILAPVVSARALADLIGNASGIGEEIALAPRIILSGLNYRDDVLDLAQNPSRRWLDYKGRRASFGLPMYGSYTGPAEDVVGLTWNPDTKTLLFPARLSQVQRDEIERDVRKSNQDLVASAGAFTAHWVQRIVRRYQGKQTLVILLRLPSTPLPQAVDDAASALASFVVQSQGIGNVVLAPEGAFLNLERPEYFFDGRLLNAKGRHELTRQMTTSLVAIAEEGRIPPH